MSSTDLAVQMPSSATGPYQSKFFNFLNRQSLKWRDRLETTVRHLKVTVEWGAQILLYPAYLLVQAGRMAGRELEQIATRAQLSAAVSADGPPPTTVSDRPLTAVLSTLSWDTTNELGIQGISSLLDSRRLALVTRENSLLDVLSAEQQKTLLAHIRTEVANYYYERRLAETEKQKLPGPIPNFAGEQDKILPPARWFWQVMRWVQGSPVAITVNLFGESRFGVGLELTDQLPLPSFSPSPAFVANLDRQIAQWEIAPLATTKQLLGQLPVLSPSQRQNSQTPQETTDPFSIQALILAAVDYFFGGRSEQVGMAGDEKGVGLTGQVQSAFLKLLAGVTNSESGRENLRQLPPNWESVAATEDPWLSWEELFAQGSAPVSEIAGSLSTQHPALLPSGLSVPRQEKIAPWKRIKENLGGFRAGKLRRSPTKVGNNLTKQEAAGSPTHVAPSPAEIVPVIQEKNTVETAFDWLEAKVTATGYVKHPLEQILHWLDRLVLWLEQLLGKLMRRIDCR